MKRKIIFFSITIALLSSIAFMGYKSFKVWRTNQKAEALSQVLPVMPFIFFDTIKTGTYQYTIVNYFSPDCSHCQYMALQLARHAGDFKNTHIFMVTPANQDEAMKFASDYNLRKIDFISVGIDPKYQFINQFGATMIPSFYLYGPDRKLIRKYVGETKIENLISLTKN